MSDGGEDDDFACELCGEEYPTVHRHLDADGFSLCPRCASQVGLIDPLPWECDECKTEFGPGVENFSHGRAIFCLDCAEREGYYAPEWECAACKGDYSRADRDNPHLIHEDEYCSDCIKRLFDGAREREYSYGNTKIQGVRIHPRAFPTVFDAEYIKSYEEMEIEYNTPRDRRVYCQPPCSSFLGPISGPVGDDWTTRKCEKCSVVKCMHCGQQPSSISHQRHNSCGVKQQQARASEKEALGTEVELKACPECSATYTRVDGCNHMMCRNCNSDFCYLCAQLATTGDGHWGDNEDQCPQFGPAR